MLSVDVEVLTLGATAHSVQRGTDRQRSTTKRLYDKAPSSMRGVCRSGGFAMKVSSDIRIQLAAL